MLGEKAMASEIITRKELEDAKVDAKDLGECIHGNETGVVTPRFGDSYPTLPAAVQKIMETGGFEPFPTEAQLLASTPTISPKAAKAMDTKKVWYWDGAWHDTGLSELDRAINYADQNKLQKFRALDRENILFEFSTEDGAQTWVQARSEDGMPTKFASKAIRFAVNIEDDSKILSDDEVLLYTLVDENSKSTALSVRVSDGMFPDFVIEDIKNRLNIQDNINYPNLDIKEQAPDFQMLSSIARGVARHVNNVALPAKTVEFFNSTNQKTVLYLPDNYSDATPLILCIGFSGANEFDDLSNYNQYKILQDNGVIFARCQFHGNHYGSLKALQDALEIYQKACEIAPIGGVVLWGGSMGGIGALNTVTHRIIPNVLGVYLVSPVVSLRQRYDNGRVNEITQAYDLSSNGSDYYEKTKTYDAALEHWSKYKGLPISIIMTRKDTLVPPAFHSDVLYEKLKDHNDITVFDTQAPGHGSVEMLMGADLLAFIQKCASGKVITNI